MSGTVFLIPDDPAFDVIGFDVTPSESHEETTQTTDNPVETGVIVTDHLIHEPQKFSCVVCTSRSPLGPTFFGEGGEPVTLNGVLGEGVNRQGADFIAEMADRLTALRLAGATMSVVTSMRSYTKMQLLSVSVPREEGSIGIAKFTLSFKQLYIVSTQNVNAPTPKEPRGAGTVAKGSQKPTDADPAAEKTDEEKRSTALTIVQKNGAIASFLGLGN